MGAYTPSRSTATTTIPLVDDGDDVNATNDGAGKRRLADLAVKAQTSIYGFGYETDIADDTAVDSPTSHTSASYTYGSQDIADENLFADVPGCLAGDVLSVHFWGPLIFLASPPTTPVHVRLFAKEDQGGANTYRKIPGAHRKLAAASVTADGYDLTIVGVWTIITPGICRVEFGVKSDGTNAIAFHQSFGMTVHVARKLT